jgi:cytochrome o ubiquinol oxidase subunit 1
MFVAGFAFLSGFGLIWQILWLVPVGVIGAFACLCVRMFDEETMYVIPAVEVARIDNAHTHII